MILKDEIERSANQQKQGLHHKDAGTKRYPLDKIKLTGDYVLIITGIRRCGKSTLMHQLMEKDKGGFGYFNFEDPRIFGFEPGDFPKLHEVLGEKLKHFYFDEIQNVQGWERFVRELSDNKNKICITGSNASMLSKELGTKLTGRNIQIELFPFSFSEYCEHKKIKTDENAIQSYLKTGGFPDFVKHHETEYLQQLLRDIIYRDIIVRHGLRNEKTVMDLALYLISNLAKEYSLNGLRKIFNTGSVNSIADYVKWMEDAYLFFSIPRFSWSLRSMAVNPKKIYGIDTGFAMANSLSYSEDKGRLFENMIFLSLRRTYKNIYYFREKHECDFVVMEGNKVTQLIQACVKVNTDNIKRETDGLFEAMNYFKINKGTIVTMDQEDEVAQGKNVIKLVPAHKLLK